DNVELFRVAHKLHRAIVGVHERELDIRVVGRDAARDLAPQDARFHDIGLVDLTQATLALSRQLEPGADDALDLGLAVDLRVDAATAAVGHCLDAARLAEINAAGQFAHDHQI